MFEHALDSYMDNAFPADELQPLKCKGRDPLMSSRGDLDDAMPGCALTLIDSLSTLAVMGDYERFRKSVRIVIDTVHNFENDRVVSVFELTIRVVGGLVSAHCLADTLKINGQFDDYSDGLLLLAKDMGRRLMPAFKTPTGIPYPLVHLQRGIDVGSRHVNSTCTACAGTMLLEFAALSRLCGDPQYENAARGALQALYVKRDGKTNLVGSTIDVHTGRWIETRSSVGASSDSYYEYLLKAALLTNDDGLMAMFQTHYSAIMLHLKDGPFMRSADMRDPTRLTPHMDALQAFWPGIQVLVGDVNPAMATFSVHAHLSRLWGFIPESYGKDLRPLWANSPLRPELVESAWYLFTATKDPFYREIGETIMDNLDNIARVSCGFAAIADVRTGRLEDRMDSYLLAELFKYLFLLFSDDNATDFFPLSKYILTTEGHLLPLNLSRVRIRDKNKKKTRATSSRNINSLEEYRFQPPIIYSNRNTKNVRFTESHTEGCPNVRWTDSLFTHWLRSPRISHHPIYSSNTGRCIKYRSLKKAELLSVEMFPRILLNDDVIELLRFMGIEIRDKTTSGSGATLYHLSFDPNVAVCSEALHDGEEFYQLLVDADTPQSQNSIVQSAWLCKVTIVFSADVKDMPHFLQPLANGILAHVANFGPSISETVLSRNVVTAMPDTACGPLRNSKKIRNMIVLIRRGHCYFTEKVRHAQNAGAMAAIVVNDENSPDSVFIMQSSKHDSDRDIIIPSVMINRKDGELLWTLVLNFPQFPITISLEKL